MFALFCPADNIVYGCNLQLHAIDYYVLRKTNQTEIELHLKHAGQISRKTSIVFLWRNKKYIQIHYEYTVIYQITVR